MVGPKGRQARQVQEQQLPLADPGGQLPDAGRRVHALLIQQRAAPAG